MELLKKNIENHLKSTLTSTLQRDSELDVYFNGDINQWKLDSRYLDIANIETLERLGCKSQIICFFVILRIILAM